MPRLWRHRHCIFDRLLGTFFIFAIFSFFLMLDFRSPPELVRLSRLLVADYAFPQSDRDAFLDEFTSSDKLIRAVEDRFESCSFAFFFHRFLFFFVSFLLQTRNFLLLASNFSSISFASANLCPRWGCMELKNWPSSTRMHSSKIFCTVSFSDRAIFSDNPIQSNFALALNGSLRNTGHPREHVEPHKKMISVAAPSFEELRVVVVPGICSAMSPDPQAPVEFEWEKSKFRVFSFVFFFFLLGFAKAQVPAYRSIDVACALR